MGMVSVTYPDRFTESENPPVARTGNGTPYIGGLVLYFPSQPNPHPCQTAQLCARRRKDGVTAARSYTDIPADPTVLREVAAMFEQAAREIEAARQVAP